MAKVSYLKGNISESGNMGHVTGKLWAKVNELQGLH